MPSLPSSKRVPIVFIHKGGDSYLACSLTQAKLSNPHADVYLIGDTYNRGLVGVTHREQAEYWERARRFETIYQHRNTNPYAYELFCFQRWFVLEEFLRQHQLESCLYLDSDVLLFADAEEQARRFSNYDLTLSGMSPHCIFVNGRKTLERFCDFLLEAYTDAKLFQTFEATYLDWHARGQAGGVCDMTAFGFFRQFAQPRILDIAAVLEGTAYDNSMCDATQGFEMHHGIKRIRWDHELPHGRFSATGQWLRLMALHFQGPSKGRIFEHMRLRSWKGATCYFWNRLQAKRGKYRLKFARRFRFHRAALSQAHAPG